MSQIALPLQAGGSAPARIVVGTANRAALEANVEMLDDPRVRAAYLGEEPAA